MESRTVQRPAPKEDTEFNNTVSQLSSLRIAVSTEAFAKMVAYGPKAVPYLANVLKPSNNYSPEGKLRAVKALGEIGNPPAVAELSRLLKEKIEDKTLTSPWFPAKLFYPTNLRIEAAHALVSLNERGLLSKEELTQTRNLMRSIVGSAGESAGERLSLRYHCALTLGELNDLSSTHLIADLRDKIKEFSFIRLFAEALPQDAAKHLEEAVNSSRQVQPKKIQ